MSIAKRLPEVRIISADFGRRKMEDGDQRCLPWNPSKVSLSLFMLQPHNAVISWGADMQEKDCDEISFQ